MIDIQQWIAWFRTLHALAGLPMMLLGVALVLGGWRMGRIFVVLTLTAIGAGVATHLAAGSKDVYLFTVAGALALGAVGVATRQLSVALLGGLVGTGVLGQLLVWLGLHDWPLWISLGLTFVASAAISFSARHTVVIVITSFEGAAFLVMGMVPILSASPGLYRFFDTTTRASTIFFPFALLVPTMVGTFLQIADRRHHGASLAKG